MKRTELVVGAELAYQRRTNDTDSTYGIVKATVVATEPYEKGFRGNAPRPSRTGNGVLVTITSRFLGDEQTRTEVVQLSTLVGDYAAEKTRREELSVREAERRAAWEIEKAAKAAVFEPALDAMMTEIKNASSKYVSNYTELRHLPLEVVQAITAALAAQNAQTAKVA